MALHWIIAVLIAFIHVCVGTPWATPAQEALDEMNDAEIFRAVVSSMEQWQRRHNASHHRRKRAESQVCYDELGCFRDAGPYGYLDMLPASPDDVATRFLLYASHANNAPPHDVPFSNISQVWAWAETSFNASAPTKVIVHGFGSDCDHVWVYEMKSALMAVEACNVICVDWGRGAAVPNYVKASANTRLVGKQVALLLSGLQTRGLRLDSTHVIGFSLGAHVAGFAGAQLANLSRITGLDPAGPLFESQDPRARLDSSDAEFVDVIHSNGENLILGGLGSWQPMGHVDFYPNGGRMQKGCSNLFVGAVTDILWSATEVEGRSLCNHRRAYKFFTDSLSPRCHFPAFPCESYDKFLAGGCFPCAGDKRCGNMGYYADKSTVRGTLYLITRDEEPFCAHQYHVRVESAPSDPPAVSYGKIQVTLVGSADINETFTLTQKDDAEIRVGVPLTRIAVPHPALQDPRSVQLTYTAYSGWLSSGLARWPVDKLSLTDSFGNSLSVCKKGLVLESGVPVTLPLYPGECNPPRTNATSVAEPVNSQANKSTSLTESIMDMFRYKPTPVVQSGDEDVVVVETLIRGKANATATNSSSNMSLLSLAGSMAAGLLDKPWQPVATDNADSNGLDKPNIHEDSRAFGTDRVSQNVTHSPDGNTTAVKTTTPSNLPEIKEPVLVATTRREDAGWRDKNTTFRQRALSNDTEATRPEIKEPVLNPTSPKPHGAWTPNHELKPPPMGSSWRSWAVNNEVVVGGNATDDSKRKSKQLTVQLFPQRLAAILSQAERFARQQFAPFKTGNKTKASRRAGEEPETPRRAKYFPDVTQVALSLLNQTGGISPARLVPYSHAAGKEQHKRYIPLTPEARGTEHE